MTLSSISSTSNFGGLFGASNGQASQGDIFAQLFAMMQTGQGANLANDEALVQELIGEFKADGENVVVDPESLQNRLQNLQGKLGSEELSLSTEDLQRLQESLTALADIMEKFQQALSSEIGEGAELMAEPISSAQIIKMLQTESGKSELENLLIARGIPPKQAQEWVEEFSQKQEDVSANISSLPLGHQLIIIQQLLNGEKTPQELIDSIASYGVEKSGEVSALLASQSSKAFKSAQDSSPITDIIERASKGAPLVDSTDAKNIDNASHNDAKETKHSNVVESSLTTPVNKLAKESQDAILDEVENSSNMAQPQTRSRDVAEGDVLQPVNGKTVFNWQVSNQGFEVMTRVDKSVEEGSADMSVDIESIEQQQAQAHATGSNAKSVSSPAKFAEIAQRADIASQTMVQIRELTAKNGGEVRMQLNPAELGTIEIQMDISDGTVNGKIVAQSQEVIEQLARDLQVLRQGLVDAGLQLGAEGFQFMLADQNSNGQGSDGNQFAGGQEASDNMDEGESIATGDVTSWSSPEQLVDVNV